MRVHTGARCDDAGAELAPLGSYRVSGALGYAIDGAIEVSGRELLDFAGRTAVVTDASGAPAACTRSAVWGARVRPLLSHFGPCKVDEISPVSGGCDQFRRSPTKIGKVRRNVARVAQMVVDLDLNSCAPVGILDRHRLIQAMLDNSGACLIKIFGI